MKKTILIISLCFTSFPFFANADELLTVFQNTICIEEVTHRRQYIKNKEKCEINNKTPEAEPEKYHYIYRSIERVDNSCSTYACTIIDKTTLNWLQRFFL